MVEMSRLVGSLWVAKGGLPPLIRARDHLGFSEERAQARLPD
jgi:hypothetical protein